MTVLATKFGFELQVPADTYFYKYVSEKEAWEEPESNLICQLVHPGDYCVDAGAYVGYFACLMAKCGADVDAFEPNPGVYGRLLRNTNGFRIRCHSVALTDKDGEADFYLSSTFDDGFASLIAAVDGSRWSVIRVKTGRLDGLMALDHVRFLKLDVEGVELYALRGLGERLADVDHILIECIDLPYRVDKTDSTVDNINRYLSGWTVRRFEGGTWKTVPAAFSNLKCSENFLFSNPKLKGEL